MSESRGKMQGGAGCRAARAQTLTSHTALKPSSSVAHPLEPEVEVEVESKVIAMKMIIRWLPEPSPRQRHASSKNSIGAATVASPEKPPRIPAQRLSKGRTAQCVCTVKCLSYAFSHERNVNIQVSGAFLSSAPGEIASGQGAALRGHREMLRCALCVLWMTLVRISLLDR